MTTARSVLEMLAPPRELPVELQRRVRAASEVEETLYVLEARALTLAEREVTASALACSSDLGSRAHKLREAIDRATHQFLADHVPAHRAAQTILRQAAATYRLVRRAEKFLRHWEREYTSRCGLLVLSAPTTAWKCERAADGTTNVRKMAWSRAQAKACKDPTHWAHAHQVAHLERIGPEFRWLEPGEAEHVMVAYPGTLHVLLYDDTFERAPVLWRRAVEDPIQAGEITPIFFGAPGRPAGAYIIDWNNELTAALLALRLGECIPSAMYKRVADALDRARARGTWGHWSVRDDTDGGKGAKPPLRTRRDAPNALRPDPDAP